MSNTLEDLNAHLFEQLERLSKKDLSEEELEKELKRTEGIKSVSEQIIRGGELAYKAAAKMAEYGCDQHYIDGLMPNVLKKDRALEDKSCARNTRKK